VVLAFDLVIGLTTYGRINGANVDDLRAVHGMARIRHAYTEIAPLVDRYFTTPTHDDIPSLMSAYGAPSASTPGGNLLYGLTTSGGMIGLITSMVGGVLAAVMALILGVDGSAAIWVGVAGTILMLVGLVILTFGRIPHHQAALGVLFPRDERPAPDRPE
jgi:hypothetical protein